MRDLIRPMLPMLAILLVPIIPFLLFGSQMESWYEAWQKDPPSKPLVAAVVVGLLAADIFLPVPSSLVSTLAGLQLGAGLGTLVSWLGMNLGTIAGFALARRWGKPFVGWMTSPAEFERAATLTQQYGETILVVARGVPVLAEASVLLLGLHGLSWRRFLPPVLLANLGLAAAYAAFGQWTENHGGFAASIAFSIALPVLMAVAFKFWSKR